VCKTAGRWLPDFAAKAGDSRVAPILLPDYVNPEVKEHHLSAK